MLGRASLGLAVAAALAAGGCQTCRSWDVSAARTDLAPKEAEALDRMSDGLCDTTILPFMPPLISDRHSLSSTGEGDSQRRTLREEHGGLFDLLTFRRVESVYGAGGRLVEWREDVSFLLGISQRSQSGNSGTVTNSSWRLLGGLIGTEERDGRRLRQFLWIPFGD